MLEQIYPLFYPVTNFFGLLRQTKITALIIDRSINQFNSTQFNLAIIISN